MTQSPITLEPTLERALAIDLFNHVWDLLDRNDRTQPEDDDMVHSVHASCYHWSRVGGPEQFAIGEWQCSRVYAVLGHGQEAMHHAQRCLQICTEAGFDNYIPASAHEAIARAWCVLGDFDAARQERNIAYGLAVDLDDDDRGVIESDLATLPIPLDEQRSPHA